MTGFRAADAVPALSECRTSRAVISVAANYELTNLSWGNLWTPAEGDPIEAREPSGTA